MLIIECYIDGTRRPGVILDIGGRLVARFADGDRDPSRAGVLTVVQATSRDEARAATAAGFRLRSADTITALPPTPAEPVVGSPD